jgi:asparagine synthase (glutamine-hydrolysing)
MCGLTGFVDFRLESTESELLERARAMARRIEHRGPDDSGEWADASVGVAFGFRRLAIIDLSAAGHQPMRSASGRYVIQFNGEVYNFESIRRELEIAGLAPEWRGHSDTEVMLAAIEAWGLVASLKRFIGMFAFALFDREDRALHLVRDRFGVKPMYYGWGGRVLLFGSELKAMRAHPSFESAIDRDALALYVRHNYIPEPHTIYGSIRKLRPGCIVSLDCSSFETAKATERVEPFWSAREAVRSAKASPFVGSEADAADQLENLLRDAVGLRMISDVPLGVFLSGGIDSSLVTAMMQVQSDRPVRTFSIGFHEKGYDEAAYAKLVAAHLGTEHTELYVTPEQARDVIPMIPKLYDEPFADSSQIPTYLVSWMARRHVTVSLSGDGGDELFGGYNRYFMGKAIWRRISWVPSILRKALGGGITAVSPRAWEAFFAAVSPIVPRAALPQRPADKLLKGADILGAGSLGEMYLRLVSQWTEPTALVAGSTEPTTALTDPALHASTRDDTERMMLLDTLTYLPGDILTKVDRASMGVSLEAREPLLDHRLFEFAWSLPPSMKVRDGAGKWILRRVLARHVPKRLFDRPKMGFGLPIDRWLRGPLREWAEALLDEKRLTAEGFLSAGLVRRAWDEHLSGRRNWQYHIWTVLVFQQWLEATE